MSLGTDSLLVQGAGGNVSWKNDFELYVKASGMWLERAQSRNIFVKVNLRELRTAFCNGDYENKLSKVDSNSLRASIETTLHALMPQTVVVHLHMIDALVDLVKVNPELSLSSQLPSDLKWICVDYHKPGAALAKAVEEEMALCRYIPSVIFLKNHGVVIGGKSVVEVMMLIEKLTKFLRKTTLDYLLEPLDSEEKSLVVEGFSLNSDPLVNKLAQCDELWQRLERSWCLYPDHAVFLGGVPFMFNSLIDFSNCMKEKEITNQFVFVKGVGVFCNAEFSSTQQVQLRCYYDVLSRVEKNELLVSLKQQEIKHLVDWDSESYRIGLSRQ